MNPLSYLNNSDIGAFEGLYQQYLQDAHSVDPEWRNFFEGFEFSKADYTQSASKKTTEILAEDFAPEQFQKELAVSNLIGAYRQRGTCSQKPILYAHVENMTGQLIWRTLV
jgi:2-oxoglutarate dehydrogenase E1 component